MEECMGKIRRLEHEKQFLATFQRVRGFPKPSAASKQLVNVQVRFLQITNFADGGEILLDDKIWKLPQGAVALAMNDSTFKASLLLASLLKYHENLGPFTTQQTCVCCSRQASTYLPSPCWKPELNAMKWSFMFLCGHQSCDLKAKEIIRVGKKIARKLPACAFADTVYWCNDCLRPEPLDGPKLFACGNCKLVFYCNKSCQERHWTEHKLECKHNFRGKIKKEEKLNAARMFQVEEGG